MRYKHEKQVAIQAAIAAATLCEQVRSSSSFVAIQKHDRSPVTVADFGAQAVICQAIAAAFPADAIIAEESAALLQQPDMATQLQQVTTHVQAIRPDATAADITAWIDWGRDQTSSRCWTLDPIDGTKGFLRGDQYAIAIALIESGEIKVGAIACPRLPINLSQPDGERGVVFVAVRGQGAEMLSLSNNKSIPIHVANAEQVTDLCLIESVELDHGNPQLQRKVAQAVGLASPPIAMDSLAKYGVVAQGQAALYLRLPWVQEPDYRENIWDHAAGVILVEEAGGCVTDISGKPLDFSVGPKLLNNQGIIASNGTLHPSVLNALNAQNKLC